MRAIALNYRFSVHNRYENQIFYGRLIFLDCFGLDNHLFVFFSSGPLLQNTVEL